MSLPSKYWVHTAYFQLCTSHMCKGTMHFAFAINHPSIVMQLLRCFCPALLDFFAPLNTSCPHKYSHQAMSVFAFAFHLHKITCTNVVYMSRGKIRTLASSWLAQVHGWDDFHAEKHRTYVLFRIHFIHRNSLDLCMLGHTSLRFYTPALGTMGYNISHS